MIKAFHTIVFLVALCAAVQAQAQSFAFGGSTGPVSMTLSFSNGASEIVTAVDQGWWSPTQNNFAGNTNIITGNCFGVYWNDFFVFDFSGQSGTVVAASLDLNTFSVAGAPTFSLWDVSTPIATLENLDAVPNATIYADLGSGTRFSDPLAITTGHADIGVPLNNAGVAAINNALGGSFAIGGSTNVPTPEPRGFWPLTIAIMSLGAVRYRARQAAKRSALA